MSDDSTAAGAVKRWYFEDFQIGRRFSTGTCVVTEAQIKAFATQFDPQPFHLDAEAASTTLFGGLVASGWHTAAISMRLLVDAGPALAGGTVGLGAEISWPQPVRPGDILHVDGEVIDAVPSRSRPGRGRVTTRNETRNERGAVVQLAITKMLVPRRAVKPGN